MVAQDNISLEAVKAVLAQVPDPEIPVLTLNDLGIIREVSINETGAIEITLTPTYMGCPATYAIRKMVSDALLEAGFPTPILKERLSPAWTSDWISAQAKEKLRQYGIAPPSGAQNKTCPLCGSQHSELVSHFGSTPCKALYRCLDCKEPFEYFKCH